MRPPTSQTLSDTATVLGLVSAVLTTIVLWAGVVAGLLAILVFVWSILRRRRERARDATLLDAIKREMSLDRVLDVAARHLSLGGTAGGWRLSLYQLDVTCERWVLQARASSNELYADDRDFPTLNPAEGVLRSCLAGSEQPHGRLDEIPVLPPPISDGWLATMLAWGFPEQVARNLRMKSRTYCGAVFKVGPQDGHQSTLGLVAESEAEDGVNLRTIEAALTRPFFEAMAELVLLEKHIDELDRRTGEVNR